MARSTRFGVPKQEERRCPQCGRSVPVWHFLANPVMPNGADVMCYQCRAKFDNHEQIIPLERAETAEERRVRQTRGEFSAGHFRQRVLERDGGACIVCGGRDALEIHHLVPVSEGGKNVMFNLATLCATHHRLAHSGAVSLAQLTACLRDAEVRRYGHSDL